jgi:hypothetical protein
MKRTHGWGLMKHPLIAWPVKTANEVIHMTAAAETKSGVVFSPDKKTAVHTVGNGNVFTYKEYNGVYCKVETPDEVVRVLDSARRHRTGIRLRYGHTEPDHPECGRDWMEENDVAGYVSNTVGPLKVPILVHNARSDGGMALLDNCIVKIVTSKGKRVLYQHPKYNRPTITVREIEQGEKVGHIDLWAKGYTHTVCFDGQMTANFKSLAAAQRFVQKMS